MHPVARTRWRRTLRRSLAGAAAVVGATGLVLAAPGSALAAGTASAATAAPAVPSASGQNPRLDWLGSSIPAHADAGTRPPSGGAPSASVTQTPGMDVSHYQGTVDWDAAYASGARFAYMKATEGTTYRDPTFAVNYAGSADAGLIRGAYHFANPDTSSGTAQADFFVAHGGGWTKDGRTLPPMLDIEYGTSAECWGLSQSAMVTWISQFVNEVHARTTRWPTIYTTTDWWTACTGDTPAFSADAPLFVARYASSAGVLPSGWPLYTFWQFADSGTFPGDQDRFNGPLSGLRNLANDT